MDAALTTIQEAITAIGGRVSVLPTVWVSLERAQGLVLAAGVATDVDYPPFDRAIMDGFAVRSADCRGAGGRLRIVGEIPAGAAASVEVHSGQAVRINTGAPMPVGADAVVIIEHCAISADGQWVTTADSPTPGTFVATRGSCVRAGDVVLGKGVRLGPAQIVAVAAAGAVQVQVYRRPRVAVLVTGDELVSPSRKPTGAQIRDCNRPMLLALIGECGCEAVDLGMVGDSRSVLIERVSEGLRSADVLCISGGVSMGQHDLVPAVLAELGVDLAVRKVSIKPGKPVLMGQTSDGRTVFGLPGNPVSSFVGFTIFVRAALEAMQGRTAAFPRCVSAVMGVDLPAAGTRAELVPCVLTSEAPGRWRAELTKWQGSGDPFGLARANGLLYRVANDPPRKVGSLLPAVPLE